MGKHLQLFHIVLLVCIQLWRIAMSSSSSYASHGCSLVQSRITASLFKERPHSVSIAEFGGINDGNTLNTQAFERAIQHISAFANRGGATLYIPKGRWLTGCFNLTSHITIFLEEGAVILASQDPRDWPVIDPLPSYGRGRELPGKRYTSLIHGHTVTDVAIKGNNGTIDGQGLVWWTSFRGKTLKYTRGSLLEFMYSSNLLIHNVTFVNSPFWTIHPVYTSNMLIKGVTILAPHKSPNTDGIDPDSSFNVCIQDCYISNGDDAVAVKSGWDEYGLQYHRPSHDIFIHNVIVSGSHGISLGSEMSGGIYSVHVDNVAISEAVQAIHVKTSAGRGAYIVNATFANFQLFNTGVAISFTGIYGDHPDNDYDPNAFATIENISIQNMVGSKVNRAGDFRGVPQSPFRNICLRNISLEIEVKPQRSWNCSYIQGYAEHVSPKPCSSIEIGMGSSCFYPAQASSARNYKGL